MAKQKTRSPYSTQEYVADSNKINPFLGIKTGTGWSRDCDKTLII
jgi:hypothetical protein